jgi:hypothetical protein
MKTYHFIAKCSECNRAGRQLSRFALPAIGNALLNLDTQILRSNLPADKAGLFTNIFNTAY